MLTENLAKAPFWIIAFLFSTTVHEAAHAFVALRLGDPTAYLGGQVSLNPIPHIRRSPFGMVVVPILSFVLNGWMLGWASAPYDPRWAYTYPRRAGWMALAGPVSNLLLATAAGLAIRLGIVVGVFVIPDQVSFFELVQATDNTSLWGAIAPLLGIFVSLNALLAAFNMMPLPPLDGSAVIQLAMPEELARSTQEFLRQPMISMAGLLIAWKLFGSAFQPLFGLVLALLYPEVSWR